MTAINKFSNKFQQSIRNLIEKEGFLTYEIETEQVLTNGASFLGELYQVDVKGTTKDGDKEMNLFLKFMKGCEDTKWISISNIYTKELLAYKELSGLFTKLQEYANVPSQERYKMAKCYEDSYTEAIILENITKKGFIMYDRMKVVTLEFAETAMRELAKLNGLSFALQKKQPDYFNKKIKEIQHPIIHGDDFNIYVRNMIDITMNYIDDDDRSKVEITYHKLADKYAQFFDDGSTRRCICHGDYRSSNMMIKTNNGKINDFIIVDYQFLHYGCPVLDILYFLYINTDRQFRKNHLSHLKDLYHETLTTFLGYFNIDVDLAYSRETFEHDFKEKLDYGLLVGFSILPLMIVSEEDVPEVTGEVIERNFRVNDTYRDRQRGMIEEFTEWGYIL